YQLRISAPDIPRCVSRRPPYRLPLAPSRQAKIFNLCTILLRAIFRVGSPRPRQNFLPAYGCLKPDHNWKRCRGRHPQGLYNQGRALVSLSLLAKSEHGIEESRRGGPCRLNQSLCDVGGAWTREDASDNLN
ncbi:hypothetical protein BaRGS_00004708, partial [Batillaria attramentaria]